MKILLSHPTGNANVRAVSTALANANILKNFITSIAFFENTFFFRCTSINIFKEFRRRKYSPILRNVTRTYPTMELGRLISQKFKINKLTRHENGVFCIDNIYRNLDLRTSTKIEGINAVYAYEDGAFHTFKKAKEKNIFCLYDLPIGYWRSMHHLLDEERKKRPKWAVTLTNFNDSEDKLIRKDEELSMADAIFVASTFTKKTLESFPKKLAPIYVIPYGFPEPLTTRNYRKDFSGKIKLLFIGSLSQRKGLADLLEAVKVLKDRVELTLVGNKTEKYCEPLEEALLEHHWIPSLSHPEILDLMQQHDIFVFPSLFEGYGLVIAESMAQGTPVITTSRTCGADFIVDGKNGWLTEAGHLQSLTDKLESVISQPTCIEKVGRAAMETARKYPISGYGENMVSQIKKLLS